VAVHHLHFGRRHKQRKNRIAWDHWCI